MAAERLDRMVGLLRHRGPDQEGRLRGDDVELGMRRLAVIDPQGSEQPVRNEMETVSAVCNGEIYNFRELRQTLVARGHCFRTQGDAEVIVHLYEEYGLEFVHRLRGMFAIALWDERRKRLVLARDRIGIKPLHYTSEAGALLFSSELGSLCSGLDRRPSWDRVAVAQYLAYGYIPAPRTIYSGVAKLPPGCLLVAEHGKWEVRQYWTVPTEEDREISFDEAAKRLRELLLDSVSAHLVSDVPLGVLLSGGIDSSSIAAAAAAKSAESPMTFSVGFEHPEFDELPYAEIVAKHLGTRHRTLTADPEIVHLLPEVIRHHGEPFADASSLPTWVVSQLARSQVTVALSGDGGDELFGGYSRYLVDRRRSWVEGIPVGLRQQTFGRLADRLGPDAYGVNLLRDLGTTRALRYLNNISTPLDPGRGGLLSGDFYDSLDWEAVRAPFVDAFERVSHRDFSSRLMYVDLHTYLPDDVLTKVDRMSMAHSLEVRPPLLDHKVVEFAMSLPGSYKIRGSRTKSILHAALGRELPEAIRRRGKQGFGLPIRPWLRTQLRQKLESLVDPPARLAAVLDRAGVARLVDEHLNGRRDQATALWKLLVLLEWEGALPAEQPSGRLAAAALTHH